MEPVVELAAGAGAGEVGGGGSTDGAGGGGEASPAGVAVDAGVGAKVTFVRDRRMGHTVLPLF
jgi:hypothetical protein